jgi:hypothetical protein
LTFFLFFKKLSPEDQKAVEAAFEVFGNTLEKSSHVFDNLNKTMELLTANAAAGGGASSAAASAAAPPAA